MAYSLLATLKRRVRQAQDFLGDVELQEYIDDGDEEIQAQLQNKYGALAVMPGTPMNVRKLSEQVAVANTLRWLYSKGRVRGEDVKAATERADEILQSILDDRFRTAASPTVLVTTNKSGYQKPTFGRGVWGDRVTTTQPPPAERTEYEFNEHGYYEHGEDYDG